jgi:hypothetical protein
MYVVIHKHTYGAQTVCTVCECDYVLLCIEESKYNSSFYVNCLGTYSPYTLLILNLYCIMLSYKCTYSVYVIVLYLSTILPMTFPSMHTN